MEATIVSFRRGRRTQYKNQMIAKIASVNSKEKAKAFVGKSVIYTTPAKKEIKGKVASTHGNSGCLRLLFEKGMPGQALLQKVKVI